MQMYWLVTAVVINTCRGQTTTFDIPDTIPGINYSEYEDIRQLGSVAGATCPASCYCELEGGYISCIGEGEKPPVLPDGLQHLEMKNFFVPELEESGIQLYGGVQELQLHQCNLSSIGDDTFRQLSDLDRLILSKNNLMTLSPYTFRGISKLRLLDLSSNQLENLVRPFSYLYSLEHLYLQDNRIERLEVDTFQGLSQVQYINLDRNNVSFVDIAAFQHLRSLAHLILSNNPLSTLVRLNFFGSRLQYIDISNIGIRQVPQSLTQYVRDLRLAKNQIKEINRGDLDSYPDIRLLVLDDNQLEFIEEDSLGRHEYLTRLWMNGNKLQQIPQLLPSSLRALYIEENKIEKLEDTDFKGLLNMTQLFLQRNQIEEISKCAFCDLVNLKNLDLQNNKLTNIDDSLFMKLEKLSTLDLSQNPLSQLGKNSFLGLKSIQVLQMSRIHTDPVLSELIFQPLKSLEILELYGSPKITKKLVTTTRILQSLIALRELNIMHNNLESLREDFGSFFLTLRVAKLSGNMWHCARKSVHNNLRQWMTESEVLFYGSVNVRCAKPQFLRNKPIIHLTADDIQMLPIERPDETSSMPTTTVQNLESKNINRLDLQNIVISGDIALKPTFPPNAKMSYISTSDAQELHRILKDNSASTNSFLLRPVNNYTTGIHFKTDSPLLTRFIITKVIPFHALITNHKAKSSQQPKLLDTHTKNEEKLTVKQTHVHEHLSPEDTNKVILASIVGACAGSALIIFAAIFVIKGRNGKRNLSFCLRPSSYYKKQQDGDGLLIMGQAKQESENSVGLLTESHFGLNNRLYLVLQSDLATMS